MDTASRPKALVRKFHESIKDLGLSAAIGIVLLWCLPGFVRCWSVYIGAAIFLANVIYTFVVNWKPKGRIQISGKAVVISGCDSGFGHMLAERLDDLGFQVFAGCLFPDGDGAQKLRKAASSQLHILKMDVTKDQDVKEAVTFVEQKLGNNQLWAVVCNAGIIEGGEIAWTNFDTIKKVLEVNTFGVVRLTKAFLSKIVESKGRVVAVSSAAGRYTFAGMVPYCMSKNAVISFCDGLRLEMAYRWGIQVIAVEPTTHKTNLTNEENVLAYLKRNWDDAPEKTKNRYPADYFQQYVQKLALKTINTSPSNRPSDVVACLEEAVTAKNPKYTYNPGTVFLSVQLWILQRLPKPIADFLLLQFLAIYSNQ